MPGVGVQVEGLRETVRALQRAGIEVQDLKEVFGGIAAEGASVAAGFAPRLTGRLAASIRGNRAKNRSVIAAGRARIPYAGPINYGWRARGIEPSMFMQRADRVIAPRAVQMLDEGLTALIEKVGLDE
jgi:hypothetical protein